MNRSMPPILAVVLLALGACATSSYRNHISPTYTSSTFNYAAGGRDLKVDVFGNPTNLDQAVFAQAVVDAMQGHNPGQPTHLTLTPGRSARPLYRLVVAFNPAAPVNPYDLCRGPIATGPSVDKIQVRAAFCEGRGTLTSVRGETPADTSIDSGDFQLLMAAVARQLMPRDNPDDPRRDDRRNACHFVLGACD